MAITSGNGPHRAWLSVDGSTFPITTGSVSQSAKRKTSTFSVTIPMSYPGAAGMLAEVSGDAEASVSVLTRSSNAQLIVGHIHDIDFEYIGRAIRVSGGDKSTKLHDNKTSEKWLNKMPSDIVSELIGRVGLSGNVTSSSLMAGKKLEQDFVKLSDNVSFSYLIHKMAEFDGARWFVDNNGVFQYVPLNSPTGVYSISVDQSKQPISSDCLALKAKRNVRAGMAVETTVKAWHPKKKRAFSYTSIVPGNGGPLRFNYHIPNLVQDQVQQYARSLGNEKVRHEIMVSATVVGDSSVNAGMGLALSGTEYFDQTLDIDTVHHDIGMGGHATHITARSAKSGRKAS